jgi:hypothetical protein
MHRTENSVRLELIFHPSADIRFRSCFDVELPIIYTYGLRTLDKCNSIPTRFPYYTFGAIMSPLQTLKYRKCYPGD